MKILGTLTAVLLCGTAAAADDYLVRVNLDQGRTAASVAGAGVPVLMQLDGYCLVRASAADLERLAVSFRFTVLDDNPATKRYVYVTPPEGFNRGRLHLLGDLLTGDGSGVVMRTTEEGVEGLNRLPVELAEISLRPMVRCRPSLPEPAAIPDSLVWLLVNRVSQDSLEANLRRLIGFYTRYTTTESCFRALSWVRQRFVDYGCDSTHLDTFRPGYTPNAIGIKRGAVNPRRVYIICGHVDNTSEQAPSHCPGSDDNASGAGLVLEMSRVFADVQFDNTLWFVGFSGEEQGLVGSDSFVAGCRRRGDSIMMAMNFDMVSFGRDDSLTIVHTTSLPQTESLARFYLAQADSFSDLKAKDTVVNEARSDHYSFWKYGYLAIRGRFHDETPMYHTTGDTIGPFHYYNCGTNNLPLYKEISKATVAAFAKWAGAHQPVGLANSRGPAPSGRHLAVKPSVGAGPFEFRFGADHKCAVQLDVFDAVGRPVRRLGSTAPAAPGTHAIIWDGRDDSGRKLPAGSYVVCPRGTTASPPVVIVKTE
jgi:hypothetical protein